MNPIVFRARMDNVSSTSCPRVMLNTDVLTHKRPSTLVKMRSGSDGYVSGRGDIAIASTTSIIRVWL